MNIAVVGSRKLKNYRYIEKRLLTHFNKGDILISGGANGADSLAEEFADKHGYLKKIFPANWELYGRSAGYKRNVDIVENCDLLIAFWDGESKGTKHSINLAKNNGKKVKVYYFENKNPFSDLIN